MELIDLKKDLRADFPALNKKILDKNLIYFDTAASAQKPQSVIDELSSFYSNHYSNVSRGVHTLCVEATFKYEDARKKVQKFINAKSENEIIFTKNATESINLISQSYYKKYLKEGDEIILSVMEHHSNLLPWFLLRDNHGINLKFINIDKNGDLDLDHFESLINDKTKLVAVTHLSNVFGTITDKKLIDISRANNLHILLDGCQSISHIKVDMQELDCDFYAFSGHKLYGPSGIGVLYGKENLLDGLPPFLGGGGMINEVTFEKATYASLPGKFEAGTPPLVEAYGLGVAIDYVEQIGMSNIEKYENELTLYADQKISELDFVKTYSESKHKTSIISFNLNDIHAHEVASFLDVEGIAVRAGHHCCQPLMKLLNVPATSRLSFGIYNDKSEVDSFVDALVKCKNFFKV
ncbi:MAG: cysteine desulfurase [Candidatus Pelagibacterales bacterium]|jgi:cysteine desulfurase/selenocysteine lyase